MVDGDPVQPGAHAGVATELVHLAVGLEEHVMRGVLGPRGIAQQPEREIVEPIS